ncbi:plasmid mobilization protein [Acidiphilium iwatense]|uniref:Ribbon-helix-helix protein CopG domain-containing protein n=1 Tax=Acidiphilium iwatense TaxID=768198 RepID=A0ABS9E3E1_9PROT|nr:hypothetical protein [Acidiphilium iwatense]MCF3948177.1 hypothetical protein [Acidiphilium iwatense]
MAATSRLMVLMSPEERAALDAKARAAGISAGELLRRGAAAYEIGSEAEAAELRALIDLFNETHPETLRRLDENEKAVARILAEISASRAAERREAQSA